MIKSKYIIGVPTVARCRDYLLPTVKSIISAISECDRFNCRIVIFNAEPNPSRHPTFHKLSEIYPDLVGCGFIHLVTNEAMSARLSQPQTVLPQIEIEARWMAKQALDAAALMEYCKDRCDYYLHVEDDIVATRGFMTAVETRLNRHIMRKSDWTILSFYNAYQLPDDFQYTEPQLRRQFFGLIGQLIRSRDLSGLSNYIFSRYTDEPVDTLVATYVLECDGKIYVHSPSLFQHIGTFSSFLGKIQPWNTPRYREGFWSGIARRVTQMAEVVTHSPSALLAYLRFKIKIRSTQRG